MSVRLYSFTMAAACALRSLSAADEPASERSFAAHNLPQIERVDFERHVMSVLSRAGCNSGACHGSFVGQAGFRLSLFGQSPPLDYAAIVGDPESGRVQRDAPDDSLILAKPSGRIDHAGGLRLPPDSWEYALLRRWIGEGAAYISRSGDVAALRLEAADIPPLSPGASVQLKVIAHFANGQTEEVTAFSDLRSRDEAVAAIDSSGRLTARASGHAAVVAAYRGAFTHLAVIVPFAGPKLAAERLPPANLIDEEIDQRLDVLRLASSPPASDAEFLRRATLDVLGTLPAPDEVRRFLADDEPARRAKTIDRLLAHPRRAIVWASKMCDITACNIDTMESPDSLRPKRAKMWHDWFRRRFAENRPYDEVVRGVLCATSRGAEPIAEWIAKESLHTIAAESSFDSDYAERPQLDLYWRRTGADGPVPVEDLAELTASAFLGLRLHCARCHHHPYDRWSQRDFAGFARILARVQFGSSTELRTEMNRLLEDRRQTRAAGQALPALQRVQEVFVSAAGRPLIDAAAESDAPPQAPGGPVFAATPDPRVELADWLTQPGNPLFARSFVNRIWARYFGAGLVEPVDDLSDSNPASHPDLLDRLAAEFVRAGYDVAHIERLILSSHAYQRSSRPFGNNAGDARHLAHAPVRPLPAETLIDALNAALETTDDFGPDVPPGSTAHEIAPNRLSQGDVNALFRVLGRGDRRSLCDCDRATGPSIRQPLWLMSDPRVLQKIPTGRLARLLSEQRSDAEIVDEFYLAALSRPPDDAEREFLVPQIASASDRTAALVDVVWAIINTREFSTNH